MILNKNGPNANKRRVNDYHQPLANSTTVMGTNANYLNDTDNFFHEQYQQNNAYYGENNVIQSNPLASHYQTTTS